MFSRFSHIVECIRIAFFVWLNNILLRVHTAFCLSIHLLMDIWIVSTCWLIRIIPLWTLACKYLFECPLSIFVGYAHICRSGFVGSYGNSVSNFLKNWPTVFHSGCPISYSYLQWTTAPISPDVCLHSFSFSMFWWLPPQWGWSAISLGFDFRN